MSLANPETNQPKQWVAFSPFIEWFSASLEQADDGEQIDITTDKTLDKTIDESASSRRETARLMLKALNAFGGRMRLFFEQGFADQQFVLEQRNMTPALVYGLIAEQVSYDVDAILRAYTQRRLIRTAAGQTPADKQLRLGLAEIDKLAYAILLAAQEVRLVTQRATVFTYLHKSLRIRLLPYVRVALIGVPYEALRIPEAGASASYPEALLAVAHEVGHYVYRSGIEGAAMPTRSNIQTSREAVETEGSWFAPWYEEIAADVFGTIIAGPHIAAEFQKLSLQKRRNLLGEDDGHHPPPALRPYIYIDALSAVGARWGMDFRSVTEPLEKQWNASLGAVTRHYTDIRLPGKATIYSICEAREYVRREVIEPLVEQFCALITLLAPNTSKTKEKWLFQKLWGDGNDWLNWPQAPHAQQPAQMQNDAAAANPFDGAPEPPELAWMKPGESIMVASPAGELLVAEDGEELLLGATTTKFDDQIAKITAAGEKKTYPESVWAEILSFGGWIDQGPSGGVAHGPP